MASITQPEPALLNKIEVDDEALMLRSN